MKGKVVKRYTVNSTGNRFARVHWADGGITDLRVRDGWKGSEETRAPEIKRLAALLRRAREHDAI